MPVEDVAEFVSRRGYNMAQYGAFVKAEVGRTNAAATVMKAYGKALLLLIPPSERKAAIAIRLALEDIAANYKEWVKTVIRWLNALVIMKDQEEKETKSVEEY
jgi:hypothetical protein